MFRFPLRACLLSIVALAGWSARTCHADDPPAKAGEKKAINTADSAKTETKASAADLQAWKKAIARRDEIQKELVKLQKDAGSADATARQKIGLRFNDLRAEFETDLQPRIISLAPRVFTADPTDADAAAIMLTRAVKENKYAEAIRLADRVIAAGKSTPSILVQKATAQFNMNDFDGAKKILDEVKAADERLFGQLAAPFLAQCVKHIAYWKVEQDLRAKEALADDLPRVLLKTNRGDIVLELFENEAPNTVANFISIVESHKYDGVGFHRVIPDFMAQGGNVGELGYNIACECYRDDTRKHFMGSLSMAHAGRDTGGAQFYITHRPTDHLNYEKGKPEANHTVFGRVIQGMDVALELKQGDKIVTATVVRKRDHVYAPETLADKRKRDGAKQSGAKTKTPGGN
jgi:cyclophilin family peptidyl-prolyl cis-trans isomerase